MEETYKNIPFADNYLCSNHGNIKSKRFLKPLKGSLNNAGYLRVQLGSAKNKHFVHRLVAETFLPKQDGKEYVNHIDGNKLNNKVENLEWCTRSENDIHAFNNHLRTSQKGNNHHNRKLNEDNVQEIRWLLAAGFTCSQIATKFSVHRRTIMDIKNKETWK